VIATTGAATFSPAIADESPAPEQVLITASPPDPVGNAAYSTTLLTEQQLTISPELDTALGQVPGLSLFHRNSSLSTNPTGQGVSLRSIGASGAGRALVTLDGVPQNDPFGGWVVWSSLPSEDIQGVEIVRGAGAGPYGAGALTGVIALTGRAGTSGVADAEGGEINEARVAGAGNVQYDNVSIGASMMYLNSGGWIPVAEAQRGAADVPLALHASNAAIHGGVEIMPGTQVTARFGYYKEQRDTGLLGATSSANGTDGSITVAHPEEAGALGWRVQGWFRDTNMSNYTEGIGPNRASTTPADDQYAVPALGWGGNAALRGTFSWLDWEVGADARLADGQSRELFSFSSGQFHSSRFAGGRTFIGGGYAEGASRIDDWLITAGVRIDEWRNYDGHITERALATGAVTLDNQTPNASGTIPTARAGLRRELDDGLFFRSAAYEGFRPPSLNELFRSFRSGNTYLEANSTLKPERLYGVEAGVGEDRGPFTWDVTGFWNEISDAVTLVTLANGPGTFPGVGFLPAGGQLQQRQNVGDIRGYGLEGEAQYHLDDLLALRGGFNLTDAHVYGGTLAPQLTGRRPTQTPRWTITGGIVANPDPLITLETYLRYESLRWSDDLNTLPVSSATTVDVQANFHVLPMLDVYAAVENLANAQVGTSRTADKVLSIEAPRLFRAGIRYTY
jgi:vitamin B12 transporter